MTRANCTPWQELKSLYEIYTIYKKIQPDIVHQVAMKPVLYGTIAARLAHVPCIINALAGLGYAFTSPSLKAKTLKRFILCFFKILLKHKNVHLIIQNQDDQVFFTPLLQPHHTHLIRGAGVDLKTFCPPSTPPKNKIFTIALVARLLWDKGIQEAIDAIHMLKEKGLKIQLVVVGGVDPQNPSAIPKETVMEWQKDKDCEWIDHTDHVEKIYHKADLAILPSYREGLPKSLLEAAACGLAIVTTDVPGCREIVVHNKNGLLVPAKDGLKLAEAIEFLYSSEKTRKKFAHESRALVEKYFSEERVVQETLALYKKI